MKAKDVLKRLVVLCDRGKITNEAMNKVLNGMVITSSGRIIGKYKDGMLVTPEGLVKTLSADKIESVDWDASIPKKE